MNINAHLEHYNYIALCKNKASTRLALSIKKSLIRSLMYLGKDLL